MAITLTPYGITYGDGTVQTSAISATAAPSGNLIAINSYTTAGTSTWTKPSGCRKVQVIVVGGGGGAASYNESGGAGGYAELLMDVSAISTVTVTVGAAGTAIAYYAAAGNGGTSSFGSYCSATGGYGANQNSNHTGGHGGVGSGGDLNLLGGSGTGHGNTGGREAVGYGGISYFGSGYCASHNTNTANILTTAPGAGGAGGAMQNYAGNNGGAGAVIVYSYS